MSWLKKVLSEQAKRTDKHFNEMRPIEPVSGGLQVTNTRILQSADNTWLALENFGGEGWVTTVDEVFEQWQNQKTDSHPLWAELVNGNTSLSLRHTDGQWRLDEISRVEDEEQRLFIEYFARRPQGKMQYQIAWRVSAGRWQPWLTRLSAVDTNSTIQNVRGT